MSEYGRPVQYNGEYFDSQTEGAWAAYLDAVDIGWQREPETFELAPSVYYTPDFYVSTWDSYLEVKNGRIYEEDCWKLQTLSRNLGKACILANGKPHNLSLYFYSPAEASYDFRPHMFKFGERFSLKGHQLISVNDDKNAASPYLPIIRDAWEFSRTACSPNIDPEVARASKQRKSELRADRRKF